MVDLISRQQLEASFRGVPFSVRSERKESSGKRHIPHEYPNSGRRYIEDLGEMPPIFSITAFVHGFDYQKRADELEKALLQEGPGILSMPNFGSQSVFAMPYSKNASQRSVGEIIFELSFQVGTDIIAPFESGASAESVFDAGDDAREAIEDVFGDIYKAPVDRTSVETAGGDILELSKICYDNAAEVATELTDIQDTYDRIKSGVDNLVKSPDQLAASLFGNAGLMQNISVGVDASSLGVNAATNITEATLDDN